MIDKVEPRILIEKVAQKLKSNIDMPEWAKFVKTGVSKQRPPVSEDWWFVKAAAILRTVEIKGPVGVSKLRTKFGSKKNNGMAPEHFRRASGKIIRVILQQLEKAGFIKQEARGVYKGRVITDQGKSLLFSTSKELEKSKPSTKKEVKVEKKKEQPKVEVKEVPKVEEKKPEVKAEEVKAEEVKAEEVKAPKVEEKVKEVKEETKTEEVKVEKKEE